MGKEIRLISHRGNIDGPDKLENHPDRIKYALKIGYDVEIDIWNLDGVLYLGHDVPEHNIRIDFLNQHRLWIHCKNKEAAVECWAYHSFCHTGDPFTYTTTGKIWLHDLSMKIDENVIIPLIDIEDLKKEIDGVPYAICTDYPHLK